MNHYASTSVELLTSRSMFNMHTDHEMMLSVIFLRVPMSCMRHLLTVTSTTAWRCLSLLHINAAHLNLALSGWPFPYLIQVGLVLLHSFWSGGHILGNTHTHHVFLHLLVSCLLGGGVPSSSGTWYCQLHHPVWSTTAGDIRISSLDMSKPTKAATMHNLVDGCKL